MFVEDNRLVLSIYRTWLQRYGFKVEGAHDGEVAVQELPLLRPDLVILDYMLPKLNGLEVLKFIRSHPDLAKTPVLVLSNAFMEEQSFQDLSAGVNKQLHKTRCTPKLLAQTIRELLGLLPPPNWESAASFPPSAGPDEAAGGKPRVRVDGRSFQKCFTRIREKSLAFAKESRSPAGAEHLKSLYQHVQFMGTRAALEGCVGLAHLTSALEVMLLEMSLDKSPLTPSGMQTITQTVDCLGRLLGKGDLNCPVADSAAKVLVVEDNPICSLAAVAAVKRAKLEAASAPDSETALQMAQAAHYDVFLLDIKLPGMNGFELCKQLRLLPQYKKTPVIFVTSDDEFQNRTKAVLSGGNDLIAKPIWPQELALKTVMRLTEASSRPADNPPAQPAARPAAAPASPNGAARNGSSESGRLEMAKAGPPGAAPNGHSAKAPVAGNSSNNRDGDNLFNKTTRDLARIESAPVRQSTSAGNGGNHKKPVENQDEGKPFDQLTREIARILFGEDAVTATSLHLTRIALESRHVPDIINDTLDAGGANGAHSRHDADDRLHQITREVARIIFNDEDVSETHLRLTRMILERCRLPEIIHPDWSAEDLAESARSRPKPVSRPRRRENGNGSQHAAGGAGRW